MKVLAAIVSAALCAGTVRAEDRPRGDDVIYVVDMQRVVTESIAGKAAKNDLEAALKKSKANVERSQLELKSMQDALQRQAAVLSKSALEAKQEELRKRSREIRRSVSDETNQVARKNNAAVEVIVVEVQKVLKDLAQKDGVRFIVERGQNFVVYANPKLDITNDVIKLFDQRRIQK